MKNNSKYIDQGGLTVVVEINNDADLQKVEKLLESIGIDDQGGGIIDFKRMKSVHFARWFLIKEAKEADKNNGFSSTQQAPISLAFASNFDGGVDAHLQEVLRVARETLIQIYSCCKDFPSNTPSDKTIIDYLKSHSKKNQLFWPAVRGGTVEQLQGESLLCGEIQTFIDQSLIGGRFKGHKPDQIKEKIIDFVRSDENLKWALTPRAKRNAAWLFKYYGLLVPMLIITLFPILPIFLIWWALVGIFNKKDNKNKRDISENKNIDRLLKNEDKIFMNQLTVYGSIKRPYWFRTTQLRLGLWIFSLNGKYRSTKGKLSGIESIHFARWSIFNEGKNVMFLSNFDGAWEIYISEFIDRSAAAMNLTFGATVGYPKVKGFFGGGANDEQAFKKQVRKNQYPCQVWYSAYPRLTMKNILNNHKIRQMLSGTSKESTIEWLKRF